MKQSKKDKEYIKPIRIVLAIVVIVAVLLVFIVYTLVQRKNVIENAEQITNHTAEYIAENIANEIGYAKSSIKLSAVTISQMMTSENLENPSEIIMPMISNTPFGGIEYIRSDGMNIMNIGEPFDASDRVYYIEGIKGNTGIWNNYHPKMTQETLMNFYTPLVYNGRISGVITGYIEATTQLSPNFETSLYGQEIYGLLVDENNMVICSTEKSEYVKDLTLDMFMSQLGYKNDQIERMKEIISQATEKAATYKDSNSEGRASIALIPETQWKVVIIVPKDSFKGMIGENTKNSIIALVIISIMLISYAACLLIGNAKRRRAIVIEKEELEAENTEIHDIIASANMGTWRIELIDDKKPRMFVDKTMKELLGIVESDITPEKTYEEWYSNIKPEALESVQSSVDRMMQGFFDENTYLWIHPTKGTRYVRCGGTSIKVQNGHILRGYHYDVDEVVRDDQAKLDMLREALYEKNEYYATLGTLEGIFYSMHVIDLKNDTVTEFNSKNQVKEIVNHERGAGAADMMVSVMSATTSEDYREQSLEFTDLKTLPERMENKKMISQQFLGKNVGWFLASFITMEKDAYGRPTKVIYTTRIIDEEKKQEQALLRKSQTDELTGLLNRRAYEEDICTYSGSESEKDFVYVSLDVNGLKVVNDTLGHVAGDELIIGAASCMKKCFAEYGRIYRTGGDEFAAIIFCDASKLNDVFADFDKTMADWKGDLVDGLTISYGYVTRAEMPEITVRQIGAIAEQRMYSAKEAFYNRSGFDRRGQKDAHKALCDLYTKILKINISDDSFQIVNMNEGEQTAEMGFSDKISEWLSSFGKKGNVHPEDLQSYLELTNLEYIRSYFAGNKTSLHVFYRRRYGDRFKQVMMEMIPASDYTSENQSLFLYVKDIDK